MLWRGVATGTGLGEPSDNRDLFYNVHVILYCSIKKVYGLMKVKLEKVNKTM